MLVTGLCIAMLEILLNRGNQPFLLRRDSVVTHILITTIYTPLICCICLVERALYHYRSCYRTTQQLLEEFKMCLMLLDRISFVTDCS